MWHILKSYQYKSYTGRKEAIEKSKEQVKQGIE